MSICSEEHSETLNQTIVIQKITEEGREEEKQIGEAWYGENQGEASPWRLRAILESNGSCFSSLDTKSPHHHHHL